MARKSRKEAAAVVVQEADAACRAAIYVRLSVEDTHTHSVSIETQQMIIARYLEQYPEISVYDTRRSTKAALPTSPWKWNSWRMACERWMLKQSSTGRWNRMPRKSRLTVR